MLVRQIENREPDPRRGRRAPSNRDRHAGTLMVPTVRAWEALRHALALVLVRFGR